MRGPIWCAGRASSCHSLPRCTLQAKLDTLSWELDEATQRRDAARAARDVVFTRFSVAMRDAQQKADFRLLVLERDLSAAATAAARNGIVLEQVKAIASTTARVRTLGRDGKSAAAAAVEPPAVASRVADAVADSVAQVEAAERQLAEAMQRHTAMIESYFAALQAHGVSPHELGFVPLSAAQAADAVKVE